MAITQKTFSVSDISIQVSADSIERKVRSLSGVRSASISIENHTLSVEFDDELIRPNRIIQAVREAGYQAYLKEETEETSVPSDRHVFSLPLAVCALLGAAGMICRWLPFGMWIAPGFSLAAFYLTRSVIPDALQELKNPKSISIFAAVLIACLTFVCGIVLLVQQDIRSVLLFADSSWALFYAMLIRDWLRYRRSVYIQPQHSLLPRTAAVYKDHHETMEAVSDLKVDQIVVIRPGEIVPADGRVYKGFAVMDESALTGWEKPVEKTKGSYVYANSKCLKGSIALKAERVGNTTAMMKLAEMAEKTASDGSFRSPFKSFTGNLFLYTLLAVLLSGLGWYTLRHDPVFAFSAAMSVLACAALPALSLTSANAVMHSARGAAAEHILFRTVDALEMTGRVDLAVMEQNHSITDDELTVTDFIPASGLSESEFEYIAYALESRSEQPFARAVTRYLKTRRIAGIDKEEFARLSSRGRQAIQSMSRYSAGFMEEILSRGIDTDDWDPLISRLRQEGNRALLFTEEDRIIGLIAAIRPMLPGVPEAVRELQNMGIDICLLSDGSADESLLLQKELQLENVIHQPARYEIERLLQNASDANEVSAYLSGTPSHITSLPADVSVIIGSGAETSYENIGLQLTRKRLSDFIKAIRISQTLNSRIQYAELAVIIYHAAAVSLFGFILPQFIPYPMPLLIPLACSAAAVFAASRFR